MGVELLVAKNPQGLFEPITPHDKEVAAEKIKATQPYRVEFIQVSHRSLQHHRMYWSGLLALAVHYWEPDMGGVSEAEKRGAWEFAKWLDRAADGGAIQKVVQNFIEDWSNNRREARRPPPLTDREKKDWMHEWVKRKVGHVEMVITPDGEVVLRTLSINFNAMTQEEFAEFYKRAFNVIWNRVLSTPFQSEEEAQNAVDNLLSLG